MNNIQNNSINLTPPPRLFYIDNLRVLACFLVLLTHSTMPARNPEAEGFWMSLLSLIGSPSSELFLALSGTVLLPVKTGFRKFYKRRYKKLIPPLVVWSVLGTLLYTQTRGLGWSVAWDRIIHIPVKPAIGPYWFVYVMVGLYLLAPYITPWLKQASKKQIELFLGVWMVNMIIPWLLIIWPDFIPDFKINGNYYWMLCYFGGFLGYWILGYYLNKFPIRLTWNWRIVLITFISVIYPILILVLKSKGIKQSTLADNLQIGSVAWVAALYVILYHIHLPAKIQRVLTAVAKYSFGIYLTHIFIARELYWGLFEGSHIHIFPRTFLIAFLTLLTGYLLTLLIGKVPGGKYITGA